MTRRYVLAASAMLGACSAVASPPSIHTPPIGITPVIDGPIAAAPGITLVVGDINLAPDTPIPRHFHHGEEFLYILGGSAVVSRAAETDVTLRPGEGLRIAPGAIHWGKAGPEGLRAVSSWVKLDGKPLREAVPE